MRQIEIIVDINGNIKVEAHGFKGNACASATADFLKALGGEQDERKKAEWYQKDYGSTRQVLKNGR